MQIKNDYIDLHLKDGLGMEFTANVRADAER